MSETTQSEALAAILDALTLMQAQLEVIDERSRGLEAGQADLLARFTVLNAGPIEGFASASGFDQLRSELTANRTATMQGLSRVAEIAAWAHAAAAGSPAPLPPDVIDDPLLERFVLGQPADRGSARRALVEWRQVAERLDARDLTAILERQYQPSPTDSARDRALRYQLAAITREELMRRGATLPPAPGSTLAPDRSAAAQRERSTELVELWRAGEGAALFAEPELAGPLDIMAAARREGMGMPSDQLADGIDALRQTIADRLAAGDRPTLAADGERFDPQRGVDRGG